MADLIISDSIDLVKGSNKSDQPLWKVLAKATGIFVGVSFIAFGALNGKALYQQIADATKLSSTSANLLTDTDKDGLPDWWEEEYGFNVEETGDQELDPDAELLINIREYLFGTNPLVADTDGDGFNDFDEVEAFFDPLDDSGGYLDYDADGMPDWWEAKYGLKREEDDSQEDIDQDDLVNADEFFYGTDPRNPDTDGDGFSDGAEVASNFNPLGDGPLDSDLDDLTNVKEKLVGTDPMNPDTDGDGLTDGEEVNVYGSDPNSIDTDRDGFSDGEEVAAGFDPTRRGARLQEADEDKDGLSYEEEIGIGTDPKVADTDGDGFGDGSEVSLGLDPTNANKTARPAGELIIEKLNVNPPVVWVEENTQEAYQAGLAEGVIHVAQTAYPGQTGNSYITGHSSDYAFKPGEYKEVLAELAELGVGDQVSTELTYSSGKTVRHTWKMYETNVVAPDDPALFRRESRPVLTLATCWPINTSWKRLYGKFELISTDYR